MGMRKGALYSVTKRGLRGEPHFRCNNRTALPKVIMWLFPDQIYSSICVFSRRVKCFGDHNLKIHQRVRAYEYAFEGFFQLLPTPKLYATNPARTSNRWRDRET